MVRESVVQNEKLAYLIKAWNAWRVGRTVRSIFWKPSTESFPVPF